MALVVVIRACVAIFSVVALIALRLVTIRLVSVTHRRRRRNLERQWLPLLVEALEHNPDRFPRVHRRHMAEFLSLWNRLHDAVRGFNASLHQVGLLVGADEAARRMFSSRHVRSKLLAITTLGRLRDRSMWHELVRLTSSRELTISLAAARAIVRTDPVTATRLLLPIIAERDDWPPATVASILEEVGAEVMSPALVDAIQRAPASRAHRLIRFLGLATSDAAVPLLRLLIRQVDNVESITACLRVFTDGSDLGPVRQFSSDRRWEVRVRAVDALGRLGTVQDEERLIAMLSDTEWWVRYRAAHALCKLLSSNPDRLRQLRASHTDPFARDILAHVLAEQEAAA